MPSILLTPPAVEPLTLAEAKAYLRVEHDHDDDVIAALIAGARIPDSAVVIGVASRTTQAINGATSYGVGISGEADKFGGSLGIALGSTNVGVIGPTAFYADSKVRVTANGADFTGGKVRLVCTFLEIDAPSS